MRKLMTVFSLCTLLAPLLWADTVSFMAGREVQTDNGVVVTAWSWAKVEYKTSEGKTKSVARKDLVSVNRTTEQGSLSETLSSAIQKMAADPEGAAATLDNESKTGSALNKEHALFLLAQLYASDANERSARQAADRVRAYVSAYKDGYFLGDALPLLARMQILGKDLDGARQTYKDMARLGSPFDNNGSQALGELEISAGRFDAALAAFRDAAKFAGNDKSLKAKADSWSGLVLVAQKKYADAQAIVEPITKDESLEDKNSVEDDAALAVAYRVLGDCLFDGRQTYEAAYNAYMMGAYYAWWIGGNSEGYCLAQAWRAAKNAMASDSKFKERMEKLEEALNAGYPNELRQAKAKEGK